MNLDPATAIVRIDATAVARAVVFAARKDVRYYLQGVCIRPMAGGGAVAIGTDGYAAGVWQDDGGRAEQEVILPLRHAHLASLKKADHVMVSPEGTTWLQSEEGVVFISPEKLIEARYPKLEQLVRPLSEYRRSLSRVYDPRLIALVNAAAKAGGNTKYAAARFWEAEAEGVAALATIGTAQGFMVLMPMKGEPQEHQLAANVPSEYVTQPEAA